MTTHGRGPLSRFWLGSVADYVVRHVERPVLLIRPPAEGEGEPSSAPITSVLVPLDYSKESQEIIGSAVSLAEVDGASLTLMMVVIPVVGMADGAFPYLIPIDPGALDDYRRQAETYLEGLAGAWRGKGLTIETKVVVGVSPTDGILEELKRPEYGVCAMATHVGRGIERMALGSVADKIIRSSEKPVLVMRTHHVEHR
jgi:nucleotide-binding universal stress UspA family protein